MEIQNPFLKWVGGKSKIIKEIIELIPKEIESYHELFLGGGSVLFTILTLEKNNKIKINKNICAYDLNKTLINTYRNIRDNPEELYDYIKEILDIYDNKNISKLSKKYKCKESYYYYIRNKYNNIDESIEKSALFIFLNKTCFRGLYREGPNGFNVPYGHYKKTPNIISYNEIKKISKLIKNVKFYNLDFRTSLKYVDYGDFVYMDPPYMKINKTSFVDYTNNGFDKKTCIKLFKEIFELDNDNIKFILHNNNIPFIKNYFNEFEMKEVSVTHSINSKNPGLKNKELIIYN